GPRADRGATCEVSRPGPFRSHLLPQERRALPLELPARIRASQGAVARDCSHHAPLVTETSSLRSLGPFSVCSSTVPMPRTYILWSTVPGSRGVVSWVSSVFFVPAGLMVLKSPITLKWSSAWPL